MSGEEKRSGDGLSEVEKAKIKVDFTEKLNTLSRQLDELSEKIVSDQHGSPDTDTYRRLSILLKERVKKSQALIKAGVLDAGEVEGLREKITKDTARIKTVEKALKSLEADDTDTYSSLLSLKKLAQEMGVPFDNLLEGYLAQIDPKYHERIRKILPLIQSVGDEDEEIKKH